MVLAGEFDRLYECDARGGVVALGAPGAIDPTSGEGYGFVIEDRADLETTAESFDVALKRREAEVGLAQPQAGETEDAEDLGVLLVGAVVELVALATTLCAARSHTRELHDLVRLVVVERGRRRVGSLVGSEDTQGAMSLAR